MDIKVIWFLIGALIALVGAICIFDARILTKKLFSFGDQNEATSGFKILGYIFLLIGFTLIFLYH